MKGLISIQKIFLLASLVPAMILFYSCSNPISSQNTDDMNFPNAKSDEEWRDILTPFQFQVLRESATERAFTGEYYNTKDSGT